MRNKDLRIEGNLPLETVGIETHRERKNFSDLPPQNYIHTWFARRPTPATRLALLASVLPEDIDDDTLLKWMGIDPDNIAPNDSIADHVKKKKATEDERDGRVYDHYGYRKSYKNLPGADGFDQISSVLEDTWDELPTVLDSTAGGGSIPFESIRYNLPTIANELNPVASVILKAVLEYSRVDGLSEEIERWGDEINERASSELDEYFPNSVEGRKPVHYMWARTIICPDCGFELPLTPNWWIERESAREGIAIRPSVSEERNRAEFELVELPNEITKEEFDPSTGTISYGSAECPSCNVTIDSDEIKEYGEADEIGEQLYCVEYLDQHSGNRGNFRTPVPEDLEGVEKARERVDSSVDLSTLLTESIPSGEKTDEPQRFGMEQWRDFYSSRQLLTHYIYWQKFEEVKEEIRSENSEKRANAIVTYLTMTADKVIPYNSQQSRWDPSVPKISQAFERHDFGFKWSYAEGNIAVEGLGYQWALDSTVEVYEELQELAGHSEAPLEVLQGDAANMDLDSKSVEAAVIDPPYYDNVMYAELSDFFYVWMRRYLDDVFPSFFTDQLTNKDDEAVANPSKFDDIAGGSSSKSELANRDYESKMSNIFDEVNRVLTDDGIFTLMFTHKKTEAWDTLTTALINAGFVIKSSHPINTEGHRLSQTGKNSADSTILLSSEKRSQELGQQTLWSEIERESKEVARKRAEELDTSDLHITKVDTILASFGPTLEVFTKNYPVVDDEGNNVSPQEALDEARDAVRDYFIDKYLNQGVKSVDHKTEWYILAWLVFEAERFPYDEGRRLAIGVGEEVDSLKKDHRMWRRRSGDILLRPHGDRVQDINKDPDNRSGRKPVDPDSLSFATALDKVHAAMHIYDSKGATETWNWMNDRNCGSDPSFKATLEALLRVLSHEHDDWKLARDLAAGETGELLELELDSDIFSDSDDSDGEYQGSLKDF
jgi:adenine-specific DNA methylase